MALFSILQQQRRKKGIIVVTLVRQRKILRVIPGGNRKYTYTSTRIFNMMLDYTPLVEVFSIDEAFLDVTHIPLKYLAHQSALHI
jgi:nucleotidyltransferase/DNA polymerase involved in DNA repair